MSISDFEAEIENKVGFISILTPLQSILHIAESFFQMIKRCLLYSQLQLALPCPVTALRTGTSLSLLASTQAEFLALNTAPPSLITVPPTEASRLTANVSSSGKLAHTFRIHSGSPLNMFLDHHTRFIML